MHLPVLLDEVIQYLEPKKGGWFFDGTLGEGGHTAELIKNGASGVIATDRDYSTIEFTLKKLNSLPIHAVHGSFDKIREVLNALPQFQGKKLSGILLDLGISSRQLDDKTRGFSFLRDAPLDMRMDCLNGAKTAREIVNSYSENDLEFIFSSYGEERFASRIAKAIVSNRDKTPINTTKALASLIFNVVPFNYRFGRKHPATKCFQALRIAVNDELLILRKGLKEMISLLDIGGRVAVISFHSLEDRIVKELFSKWEKEGIGKRITKKPIIPTNEEISFNIRSRSAKLRVFEKVMHDEGTSLQNRSFSKQDPG